MKRVLAIVAVLLLVAGIFRFAVSRTWHAPGGDGLQYYALSQELARSNTFAYGPDYKPAWSRLPGYPIFLAYVAVRKARTNMDLHLRRATAANVLLDLGTALLVFLLARRLWGLRAAWAGLALVLLCPLMLLMSCYGLSETLATFLAMLVVFLALGVARSLDGKWLPWAIGCGAAAGFAQLVRGDALTVGPAVLLAVWWAPVDLRRRQAALGVIAACALVVWLPWPIRNLIHFGKPAPAAAYWRTLDGRPLPNSPIDWQRTWGSGAPGESYLDLQLAARYPLDLESPATILPAMYDSEEERLRVIRIFKRYSTDGWTPEVKDELAALARERARRAPLRTFVILPLKRIYHLWSPVPDYELPMYVSWLRLPEHRGLFGVFDKMVFALALAGGVGLWRSPQRRTMWLLVSCLFVRTLLYGFASPIGVTARYLIEAYPFLLLLAAVGVADVLPSLFGAKVPAWRTTAGPAATSKSSTSKSA